MNSYFTRYRSMFNALALILMLLIPFLLYAAASGGTAWLLKGALAGLVIVMLYVLRNG